MRVSVEDKKDNGTHVESSVHHGNVPEGDTDHWENSDIKSCATPSKHVNNKSSSSGDASSNSSSHKSCNTETSKFTVKTNDGPVIDVKFASQDIRYKESASSDTANTSLPKNNITKTLPQSRRHETRNNIKPEQIPTPAVPNLARANPRRTYGERNVVFHPSNPSHNNDNYSITPNSSLVDNTNYSNDYNTRWKDTKHSRCVSLTNDETVRVTTRHKPDNVAVLRDSSLLPAANHENRCLFYSCCYFIYLVAESTDPAIIHRFIILS